MRTPGIAQLARCLACDPIHCRMRGAWRGFDFDDQVAFLERRNERSAVEPEQHRQAAQCDHAGREEYRAGVLDEPRKRRTEAVL